MKKLIVKAIAAGVLTGATGCGSDQAPPQGTQPVPVAPAAVKDAPVKDKAPPAPGAKN